MSWRIVVVSNRAKLDLQLGYLVVRANETIKIVINEISILLIESTAVSITTSLLSELIKRKIKVIFCDEKKNPVSELIGYYGCHDVSDRIRKQLMWSKNIKETVWTKIVFEKIKKQSEVLKLFKKYDEEKMLPSYLNDIKHFDLTNREGHAAKVYFNALFGMDFKRTDNNYINVCLNYGYTIILSAFNREVVSNGYLTQLGLFHDNMFNNFNLSSDLMEPFRTLVDIEVAKMKPTSFGSDEKISLINVLNLEVLVDGKKQYVNNAIKIYCKSIFDALNENDISLIKNYEYEL